MHRRSVSYAFLLLLCCSWCLPGAFAQSNVVSGTITDESGQPLPGVSVTLKGSQTGTTTDLEGKYSMENVSPEDVLVFGLLGYKTHETTLGDRGTVDVVLAPDIAGLDEVVVVGYGTQRRSDLTGSVSSVKGDQISSQAIRNPVQALTGLAAGVQVTQSSGEPGGGLSVRVRGGNSLIGGNEPLYVVDGLPLTGGIGNLNPNDILSIEVLKDASATAIYGSRGANGVVMVTTKKGTVGETRIEYNAYYGFQTVTKKINMMNAREFAELANVRAKNDGDPLYFSEAELNSFGEGTDWQDAVFQTAPMQNHSLSVGGGNDKTRFNISANYIDQEGIIIGSGYEQLQLRVNLDHRIRDNWKLSLNSMFSRSRSDFLFSNNSERGSGVLSGALIAPPTITPYDEDGNYNEIGPYSFSPPVAENPVAFALERKSASTGNTLLTSLALEGNITKDLVLRSTIGVQYGSSRGDDYSPSIFAPTANGLASIGYGESLNIVNENTLTYDKTLGEGHHFTVMGGLTSEQNKNQGLSASATGFLTDILENWSLQSGTSPGVPNSYFDEYAILSGLGRVNYSYKSKYLLTASIRADGSSRFGRSNRWGYFPSAALAWRVSEEPFWESLSPVASSLKIRGGWGITGNTAVSAYQSLSILSSVQTVFDDNLYIGFAPGTTQPNPALKWETTTQVGFGMDLGLFRDKVLLTVDYYSKETNDLLNSVPVAPSKGYTEITKNLGMIRNQGVEFSLNSGVLRGSFNWDLGLNFSLNRNKVLLLDGGADIFGVVFGNTLPAMNLVREGQPVGVFYGYVEDGLTEEGNIKYKDLDGNGIINTLDRTIIGDPNPDYVIGLNSMMNFRDFELGIQIVGVQGADILNYNLTNVADGFSFGLNQLRDLVGNYWTEENPDPNAKYPRISKNTRHEGSDRFVEDGSYIRVKNIRLAYHLNGSRFGTFSGSQVYVAVQNAFTFTDYSFYTPEVSTRGGGISKGVDQYGYPDARTIMLGVRVNF